MRAALSSFFGILLITTALTGMTISGFGIVSLWQVETEWKTEVQETLAVLDTTLQTTSDGLKLASHSLDQAESALISLTDAIQTAGDSLEDTLPLLDTLSSVTARDLPQAIAKSQQAIQSAQTSARIIDSTLSALASIPLIGLRGYDSSRPLSGSLAELSRSLDPISASLTSMEGSLAASRTSLAAIGANADAIVSNLIEIRSSLEQARTVIHEYTRAVEILHQKVKTAQTELPAALDRTAWFLTILLAWLGVTQTGLLLQGLDLLGLRLTRPQLSVTESTQH